MKIDVLTIFPEMFGPVVTESILGRANQSGLLEVNVHNIRDYTTDKHNKTDDYPFGGGAGMVMYAEPISAALEANAAQGKKIIYMSPRGKVLTHEKVLFMQVRRRTAAILSPTGRLLWTPARRMKMAAPLWRLSTAIQFPLRPAPRSLQR